MVLIGTHSISIPRPTALTTARAALVVGAAFAGVSIYWGLGGTAMLATVGGALAAGRRSGTLATTSLVWAAVVLKIIAAVLPLTLVSSRSHGLRFRRRQRILRPLIWVEAVVLTGYGLVQCVVGWLVQFGVIHTPATADHYALAWHAWLWDPWFLVWGLLVTATLILSGRDRWTGHAA